MENKNSRDRGPSFRQPARPRRDPELKTQAERILAKFGGARRLCEILNALGTPRTPAAIYKWTYPKEKGGTGGIIPTACWKMIHDAARYSGLILTAQDLDPKPHFVAPIPYSQIKEPNYE